MMTFICILILAYMIIGKDISSLFKRLKNVDWHEIFKELMDKLPTEEEINLYLDIDETNE